MTLACFTSISSIVKDVILTGATAVGALVAWRGLRTWNRQLKGGTEYELTRRLLKSTYLLRETIRGVRNPVMWGAEMPIPPTAESDQMTPDQIHFYGKARAYQTRWDKVTEVRSELQTELLEAEALWGDDIHKKYEPLFTLQRELFATIHAHLQSVDPSRPESSRAASQRVLNGYRDIIYDLSGDEPDEYSSDLSKSVAAIESFLKPHLRK